MNRLLKTIMAYAIMTSLSVAWLFAQETPGGYLFLGGEATARSGKSYFPVVTMDKKKIHVDEGIKTKKVSQNAPVRMRLKTRVSDRFVDVLELDFGTSSMSNLKRSSDAIADMQLAQAQSESKIALIEQGDGSADTKAAEISVVKEYSEDFQDRTKNDIDTGNYELDEVADTIYVTGEFLPRSDVPGAYCVIVVTSQRQDFNSREYVGKYQGARAKYLGDLAEGKIFKLKVRCALSEFNLRRAEYQIHLFSETGEQVAMSNSRALKSLTQEEFQKFQESLGKRKS